MYKLMHKITIIVSIVSLFLFSSLGNIEALEIIRMDPMYGSTDSDYGHNVYLETDRPYYVVEWYVDGVYAYSSIGGYEGDENGPTIAFFCTGYISGSVTGTPHTVKAVAWDQEDHSDDMSDSDFIHILYL